MSEKLDVNYFKKKLALVLGGLQFYSPEELARELLRLSQTASEKIITEKDIEYPRDIFNELILSNSPYAFYLHQWVPYQTDAKRYLLKMRHDVKHFDGRIEYNIWPNGSHCGSFKDEEVEFIRIGRSETKDK